MRVLMLSVLTSLLLLPISIGVTAKVYKWIDKKGNIHFGNPPPLSLPTVSASSGDNLRATSPPKYLPLGKPLPPSAWERSCHKSIINGKQWLRGLRKKSRRKLREGIIRRIDYRLTRSELRKVEKMLTFPLCLSAAEKQKVFFQCLADNRNHLSLCVKTSTLD